MKGTKGRPRRSLEALVFLALVALAGCQGISRTQPSILDECAKPTLNNRDWCFSMQTRKAE
jgi:hypothetical protein